MSEITQGLIDLNGTLPVQIINFLILVALLRAVAYKPIVRMMDERRAKIAESIVKTSACTMPTNTLNASQITEGMVEPFPRSCSRM